MLWLWCPAVAVVANVVAVVAAAAVDWCCAALRPLQVLGACITAAGSRGRAGRTILLHLSPARLKHFSTVRQFELN